MQTEDGLLQEIFSQLDNLGTREAKLKLGDMKSKFDTFAKIKEAEIKRSEDEVKLGKDAQKISGQSISMDVAQQQVSADQLGQSTPDLIN